MSKCCDKYKTRFCPDCGTLINPPDYEVAKINSKRHYTPKKSISEIEYIYICLDFDDFQKTKIAQHRKNAFIQDCGHDWFKIGNKLKFSPSGYDGQDFLIIIEYK